MLLSLEIEQFGTMQKRGDVCKTQPPRPGTSTPTHLSFGPALVRCGGKATRPKIVALAFDLRPRSNMGLFISAGPVFCFQSSHCAPVTAPGLPLHPLSPVPTQVPGLLQGCLEPKLSRLLLFSLVSPALTQQSSRLNIRSSRFSWSGLQSFPAPHPTSPSVPGKQKAQALPRP